MKHTPSSRLETAMHSLTCPNDGEPMESDAYDVNTHKNITHTCPSCGYSEQR